MKSLLLYLDSRLGEASTMAGLAALLTAAHVSISPGVWHVVTLWVAVIAAVLAVVIREAGTKAPLQIAEDAASALVGGIKAMPVNASAPQINASTTTAPIAAKPAA